MTDTRSRSTGHAVTTRSRGTTKVARPAGLWDIPTLAGAGALRSTVNDMLKYVRANADSISRPLGRVLATTHGERRPGPAANIDDRALAGTA